MEKTRVGIVGLGWVAQVFHLPLLTKFPEEILDDARDPRRIQFEHRVKFGGSSMLDELVWNPVNLYMDGLILARGDRLEDRPAESTLNHVILDRQDVRKSLAD